MNNVALVRTLMEAEDWQPLIDHLADDVVFNVTIPDGTPISAEIRGKKGVVGHLRNLGEFLEFRQEQPPQFFGNGERVVVLGKESFEIKKTGATVTGSEYATVVDLDDGVITRFLVIQDMSGFVDAYRSD